MEYWVTSISGIGMFLCGGPAVILGVIWFCSATTSETDDRRRSRRVGWLALVLGLLFFVQFYLFWSGIQSVF